MSNLSLPTSAIVTGASSGIGFALVADLLAQGYQVVANSRSMARLEAAAATWGHAERLRLVAGDIAHPATAQQLFSTGIATFGRIGLLINNAGVFSVKAFDQYDEADIKALIGTNLYGFLYPTQAAIAHMRSVGGGQILNITASIASQPFAQVPASLPVLTKGGINQATKALAVELAQHKIRVNAIAPGIIDTPLHTPDLHEFLANLAPAGRIGQVGDIVQAARYLTQAPFTTGVVLAVDGGMAAGKA